VRASFTSTRTSSTLAAGATKKMPSPRKFTLPDPAAIAANWIISLAVLEILRALVRSKPAAITAADCQREFERKYPELCERHHLSGEFLRSEFRLALRNNSTVSNWVK
jgi:hypothetical protein